MKISTLLKRMDRESGQGSLEYLGVVIVAGLIVLVLLGAANGWGGNLMDAFQRAVDQVTGFI